MELANSFKEPQEIAFGEGSPRQSWMARMCFGKATVDYSLQCSTSTGRSDRGLQYLEGTWQQLWYCRKDGGDDVFRIRPTGRCAIRYKVDTYWTLVSR